MTTQPNPLTIINGGVEIQITDRDGIQCAVKVLQLPIRKLARYAALQGDEAALVEFFCDQPEGWDDGLTLESHLEILRIGEELNADPFEQWIVRLRGAVEKSTRTTSSLSGSLPSGLPPVATPAPSSPTSRPPISSGSTKASSNATPA